MLPLVRLSRLIRALAETILVFACAGAIAQTSFPQEPAGSRDGGQLLQPGIVVAKVEQGYQAQRAGLRAGDVLLTWWQGDVSGNFESPFDFIKVDLDQRPLAPVTLRGLRGGEPQSWTLAPTTWGIETEPRFAVSPAHLLGGSGVKINSDNVYLELANDPWTQSQILWLHSWLLMHRAKDLAQKKRWKETDDAYKQAFEASSQLSCESRSYILRSWGDSARDRRDWQAAKDLYLRAIDESKKIGRDNSSTAQILRSLGLLEGFRLQWTVAKDYLLEALQVQQRLASFERGKLLGDLGSISTALGDLSAAEDYLVQAATLYRELDPLDLDIEDIYRRQAYLGIYRGDFGGGENWLRRALKIDLRLRPQSWQTAATLESLGDMFWYRGNLATAEKLVGQAVEMDRKVAPESFYLADTLVNLGSVKSSLGKLLEAERYLHQALSIARKGSPMHVVLSLDNLGGVYRRRGQLALAEKYYRQALKLKLKLSEDDIYTADLLNDLGRIANLRGATDPAQQYYARALRISEEKAPKSRYCVDSLAALGGIARRQGHLDEATRYFEQLLNIVEEQTSLMGGSTELRADFRAKHEDYYREYIDLLVMRNKPELAFEVLERSRARTLLETLATADLDIRKGVDLELIKKERSLQGDIKAKSERRIHLLSQKQSEDQIKAIEKEISDLTSERQDVESQIRSSSPEYAALTQPQPLSAKEIQKQLLDPDTLLLEYSLGERRSHVFVVSADSLNTYDLPRRAVIETAARRMYYLLTARNRRISGEKPAERTARIAEMEAEYPQAAARLSRMVLGPIADKLAGKRLLIVSDGALHYIPFVVLPVHNVGKTVPLVSQHEIVSLPSASVLSELRRERTGRQPAAKTVVVLADPVFDSGDARVNHAARGEPSSIGDVRSGDSETQAGDLAQEKSQAQAGLEFADEEESLALAHLTRSAADVGWKRTRRGEVYLPRLQSTRREAEAIAAATPAGQSLEALDFKANRATATNPELANYRVVHFATHALLNSKHPELSGLVLSLVDERGRPQSGFLGLEDIYNLNLPAELVVLSACETALGKDIEGEGIVGLTRGFMYAGASRVMASLWSIDDRATADQMKYFYRAMVGQGMRPAAALRAAQLKMRHDPRWSSPYFWAAFQIQGEWR